MDERYEKLTQRMKETRQFVEEKVCLLLARAILQRIINQEHINEIRNRLL
jgi:hypothetical protein